MTTEIARYALVALLGTFVSSFAQVLLKKAAQTEHGSLLAEYLNPQVVFAYAIFFGATFLSLFAYKVIPLSMGPILEATGYFYVTFFGVRVFNERMSRRKAIALGLIIVGIVVYSLGL